MRVVLILLCRPPAAQDRRVLAVGLEANHGSSGFRRFHALDDQLRGRGRECGEDASTMEPAHARAEDRVPIEVARLQLRGGFVAAIVEDHWSANAMSAIAVDGGHVRTGDAVVLEPLVERAHSHGTHAFGNQLADRVIDHRRSDARLHSEAVREVRGHIEFAAAHMDLALARLAERNDTWIQAMNQSAEGQQVERAIGADIQTIAHPYLLLSLFYAL